MGNSICSTIDGGVLKPKNANCESRVKPAHYIFHTHIKDIPETQHTAGISHVGVGTECRHRSDRNLDLGVEQAEIAP